MTRKAVITGALSYSGRFIVSRLIDKGWAVKTITGHPDRPNPFGTSLEVLPLSFEDPGSLRAAMEGADVFFNTYWVRFKYGDTTFDKAVQNSRVLFDAAMSQDVSRIVHISITKPALDSPFPYFRGKAQVEEALKATGVPHSIVRPTVIFGGGDVFINNIAWVAKRFPFFGIPGSGEYG
ncbi:MAG TPA: NAD(P)H-binding protein, partial [Actinomycetota bacterium]|nr:NAD(P)H-binding protein [Actinomycetota bacterium]